MIENIKSWLTNHLQADSNEIETYFKNNNVTGFLMIWTIFEQKLFNGFIKFSDISNFSKENKDLITTIISLNDIFNYFHSRYQNNEYYNNLIHNDNKTEIEEIRKKKIEKLNKEEKLQFLLYVVYRYRNNIFHGNKGVSSWLKYEEQIDKCVITMTELIDNK